jgi:hypothetical protein
MERKGFILFFLQIKKYVLTHICFENLINIIVYVILRYVTCSGGAQTLA